MGQIEILATKYPQIWGLLNSPDIDNTKLAFQLAKSQSLPLKSYLEPLKYFMAAIYQHGKVTKKTIAKQTIKPHTVHEVLNLTSIFIDLPSKLQKLPKEIWVLSKLQKLHIQGRLTSMPSIVKLSKLRVLQLTRNSLKQLPHGIEYLPLQILDIEGNELKEFPRLPLGLQALNITGNSIVRIPVNRLDILIGLETLLLGDNPIRRLPNCFDYLPNLRELHINDTPISDLPSTLLECSNLASLYAQNTILSYKYVRSMVTHDCVVKHHLLGS